MPIGQRMRTKPPQDYAGGMGQKFLRLLISWAREMQDAVEAGPASGSALLDFGAGAGDASVVITGQTQLAADSAVQAWLAPDDTDDHTADEHLAEPIRVLVTDVVPGVGFTIRGIYDDAGLLDGKWSVAWTWS